MKFANAINLNKKSGGAKRADLKCAIRVPRSYRLATSTNHHRNPKLPLVIPGFQEWSAKLQIRSLRSG